MSDSDITPARRIAELLRAKPAGKDKWLARCPAHIDKSPSLSIRNGRDGRALVWCFGGCELSEILKAANLQLRDLFPGQLSPDEMRAARAARTLRERAERDRALAERAAAERIRRYTAIHDELAERLAYLPDGDPQDDALTRLYHVVLDKLRAAEAQVSK